MNSVGNRRSQAGNRSSQVGNRRFQVGSKGSRRLETKEEKSSAEMTHSKNVKGKLFSATPLAPLKDNYFLSSKFCFIKLIPLQNKISKLGLSEY